MGRDLRGGEEDDLEDVGGSHPAHGGEEEEGQEGQGPEEEEGQEGEEAEEEEEEKEEEGQEEEEEEKEEEEGREVPGRQAQEGPAQEQGVDRGHLRWRLDVQARRRREQAPE